MTFGAHNVTNAERRATLRAFAGALNREAHVLTRRPHLLWQQLYNRLQWEGEAVVRLLVPELAHRSVAGATPWLRMRTPLRESRALVRTLAGHADAVFRCAISPDGSFIVSASGDGSLKIWDSATGQERATLQSHTYYPDCAISPDGSFIVSAASEDGTLKMWDSITGQELATFSGHTPFVKAYAISPDGSFVVSASGGDFLTIWDTASGAERATLAGHTDKITACAISPDGRSVVSASRDMTLRIWDVANGRERATLTGHTGSVDACAISPDSSSSSPPVHTR